MTVPEAQIVPDEAAVLDEARMDATQSLKDSPQRWWLLVLLFTAMLIGYAHRGAFSIAAPFMSEDLHLSKASIGILLSAFFWIYSFMQIPAGWLVDRFGVRRAPYNSSISSAENCLASSVERQQGTHSDSSIRI